ncbi:MAG: hypothetical protein EON54_28335 [Alcaligenaceae bacterium]|nr:MAG: hypothetical protein EON54_28335 [Alcaligenaceae bacterium]
MTLNVASGSNPTAITADDSVSFANTELDSETRSRQILSALLSFANGDFHARLPVDWPGTEGRIAEAFNHSIRQASRFTGEVAR